MRVITKADKIKHLRSYLLNIIGMTADFDFENEEPELFNIQIEEYLVVRALLIDYAPEMEKEFSEDFLAEIEKWIYEINELAGE